MDSPPETPGGSRSLTVPKRRGDRGGWAVYHPVGGTGNRSRDAGHGEDVLQHGFLHDVSVEILPSNKSTVVEVLDDGACDKSSKPGLILHLGSQLLLMAHIRFLPGFRCPPRTHTRQNSDDLIEDLERHLGGATTEYLQVRVTYRHSGFPQSYVQTGDQEEGVGKGTVGQELQPNRGGTEEPVRPTPPPPTRQAPPVPRRQTSLRKVSLSSLANQHSRDYDATPDHESDAGSLVEPAGRSWDHFRQAPGADPRARVTPTTGVRQWSSQLPKPQRVASGVQASSPSSRASSPSPVITPITRASARRDARAQTERRRVPKGNWAAVGYDAAMVALTPVVAGVQTGNNGHLRRSKSTGKVARRAEKGSGRSSSDAPEKKDKEKPKDRGWSWTSWWQ
ncbi:uncharacterized protein THITE_2088345 [Thermothielavioides terrestris NRRL 8126]|uniref:Uncharacterized protein n=1 Tax=Thermothielavioides terrestris (strain ATCC 38088 / NRRL 8126) TaxID=578455 RepID=G2R414_THETT|nr:uncharacterized protein THITE_2088345 [Thermothielavioides terrestris NRRL 8126]AEO66866.1 hypothetical protein THITE_2088345 [Thermothielavioides terrestris NRRL 8126]